jgi:hypothetical protein
VVDIEFSVDFVVENSKKLKNIRLIGKEKSILKRVPTSKG